jgi:hypothetical protein
MLKRRLTALLPWMVTLNLLVGCERSSKTAELVAIMIPLDSAIATLTPSPGEYFNGIVGAFLLQDDGIVVVDNFYRLQYFTATGQPIKTVGSSGRGPGESVRIVKAAFSKSDTLFTYDLGSGVATYWTPQGEYAKSRPVRGGGSSMNVLPLVDGSIISESITPGAAPVRGEVITRSKKALIRTTDQGATELATYDGDETLVLMSTGGQIRDGTDLLYHTHLAVDSARALVGDGTTGEITIFDGTGAEILKFTASASDRPALTARDVIRFIEMLVPDPRLLSQAHEINRALASDRLAPAITGLLVDDMHRIWVEQFSYTRDSDGAVSWDPTQLQRKYAVFSPTGEPLARITLPPAFLPTHITRGIVVGVHRTELGEESVALYEIPVGLR